MRYLRHFLLFALWTAAVAWYWDAFVPLAATKTVRLPANSVARQSYSAEVIVSHRRPKGTIINDWISCGPMEFWSFPEGRRSRELFTADDDIIYGPLETQEVMIRRDGRLLIVDSKSGAIVADLPDIVGADRFRVVNGRHQILVGTATDIRMFDVGLETPRWVAPYFSMHGRVYDDLLIASRIRRNSASRSVSGAVLINLKTGEPDARFDQLGQVSSISLSPNAQFAIVAAKSPTSDQLTASVRDAKTGKSLWVFPNANPNRMQFSPDGRHVYAWWRTAGSRSPVTRWRVTDGVEIPFATEAERRGAFVSTTQDGRYGFQFADRSISPQLMTYIRKINSLVAGIGFRINLQEHYTLVQIIEQATGQVIGSLHPESNAWFLPNSGGFIAAAPGVIRYYALPPRRDYVWLVLWTVLPALGLWLAARCRRLLCFLRRDVPPAGGTTE